MSWIGRLPRAWIYGLSRLPGASRLPGHWWTAQDTRRICRHLRLEGWELWDELAGPDGTEAPHITLDGDVWAALWSVAQFRGPVRFQDRIWGAQAWKHADDRPVLEAQTTSSPDAKISGGIQVHARFEDGELIVRAQV